MHGESHTPAEFVAEEAAEGGAGCGAPAVEEVDVGLVGAADLDGDEVVCHDVACIRQYMRVYGVGKRGLGTEPELTHC